MVSTLIGGQTWWIRQSQMVVLKLIYDTKINYSY